MSPGGESQSSTARLIVSVGTNYDTAAALMADMPGFPRELESEDEDRASLNGDEHLYADA